MRSRAASALAAAFVVAAAAGPLASGVIAGRAAARASVSTSQQSDQSGVSVAITGMTPNEAGPTSVITVTGTLTNTSSRPISHLAVELLSSQTPITAQADLAPGTAMQDGVATSEVPGATWQTRGQLQPKATAHWSISVKASKIGMTVFGAYPIEAQVGNAATQSPLQPLTTALTYLPYDPPKKGPFGYSIPARVKISWVWPLISTPLLARQTDCDSSQVRALASSLSSSGRLGQLIAAGAATGGTADAYGATIGTARTSRAAAAAARTRPTEDLAGSDGITWAIDPALLADVQLVETGCPQWAKTARTWLTQLREVSAGQPMFVTPYADPDVGSLIRASRDADVGQAFTLGRTIAYGALGRRDLTPVDSLSTASGLSDATAFVWPPNGTINYTTLEDLATSPGYVRSALVSTKELPLGSPTVTKTLNGKGGYFDLVLASQSLTALLGSHGAAAGSAFATGQEFLAQTALLAQEDPRQPIVVAPPQRWGPAPHVAADLLADTAAAPWLSSSSLASLTDGKLPTTRTGALNAAQPALSQWETHLLIRADRYVAQVQLLKANPDDSLFQAVATVESSAWRGKAQTRALNQLESLVGRLQGQEQDVQIVAEKRVTLGGLKGTVPVSIENRLGYEVQVKLAVSQPSELRASPSPGTLITIQPHDAVTVKLHVTASAVGSSTISLSLVNRDGTTLPGDPTKMTIQATQVGVLGTIVVAIALGVFLIAYAARAVRRGRPAPSDEAADGQRRDQDSTAEGSTVAAEADTVMAEHTQLGAAGAPGP
jgi:hypothetical protein